MPSFRIVFSMVKQIDNFSRELQITPVPWSIYVSMQRKILQEKMVNKK